VWLALAYNTREINDAAHSEDEYVKTKLQMNMRKDVRSHVRSIEGFSNQAEAKNKRCAMGVEH